MSIILHLSNDCNVNGLARDIYRVVILGNTYDFFASMANFDTSSLTPSNYRRLSNARAGYARGHNKIWAAEICQSFKIGGICANTVSQSSIRGFSWARNFIPWIVRTSASSEQISPILCDQILTCFWQRRVPDEACHCSFVLSFNSPNEIFSKTSSPVKKTARAEKTPPPACLDRSAGWYYFCKTTQETI